MAQPVSSPADFSRALAPRPVGRPSPVGGILGRQPAAAGGSGLMKLAMSLLGSDMQLPAIQPTPAPRPAVSPVAPGQSPGGGDLVQTLSNAGFKGDALRKAQAIAERESGGNARAFNGNAGTGDKSYGLFQINMLGGLGPARLKQYGLTSNDQLFDPATNARVAYQMSHGGTDFGAWGLGPNAYKGSSDSARARFAQIYAQLPHGATGGAPAAQPSAATGAAGGFLPEGSSFTMKRADQGRDIATTPGGPIVAPGDGEVVRVAHNPGRGGSAFGESYVVVRFTSGPYAGKEVYLGHVIPAVTGGRFSAGHVLGHTATAAQAQANVNGGAPAGWAEIGFAQGGVPGGFGQAPPF